MQKIRIVCIGKNKDAGYLALETQYQKMLSGFAQVQVLELPDEKTPKNPTPAERAAVLKKEAARLLPLLGQDEIIIALAGEGQMPTSEAFAEKLEAWAAQGAKLCFLIGGSLGLAEEIKKKAHCLLSLSRLTFPHRLARIVLLEQLFRGFKIMHHQEYHK